MDVESYLINIMVCFIHFVLVSIAVQGSEGSGLTESQEFTGALGARLFFSYFWVMGRKRMYIRHNINQEETHTLLNTECHSSQSLTSGGTIRSFTLTTGILQVIGYFNHRLSIPC